MIYFTQKKKKKKSCECVGKLRRRPSKGTRLPCENKPTLVHLALLLGPWGAGELVLAVGQQARLSLPSLPYPSGDDARVEAGILCSKQASKPRVEQIPAPELESSS
jgi:hypothetical protein